MKKIIILLMMLILVGCQNETVLSYEKTDSVVVQWGDGVTYIVQDQDVLEDLHNLLNDRLMTETEFDEAEGYLYFIDISGDNKIRIVNGTTIRIDNKDYEFDSNIKEALETVLEDYISIVTDDSLVAEETTEVDESVEEDTVLEDVDINQYVFAGRLNDGSEVYYLSEGFYFKLEVISEIIIKKNETYHLIDRGALSLPAISPAGDKIAYVKNVGFENNGMLNIYQDGQLSHLTSDELDGLVEKSRTIKSCLWYDDNRLISIVGFNTGTITQGGDVYLINVDTGDLKLLIDTKDGKEVVSLSYEDELLNFEVVTWTDSGYQHYIYEEHQLALEQIPNRVLIIEWEPKNLEIPYLSESEILSFDLYDSTLVEGNLSHLEFSDGAYHDENIEYRFSEQSDLIWRVDVIGETEFSLPRGIEVGQTLEQVVEKFPHEKNYLKSDGVFYGERSETNETQGHMGAIDIKQGNDKIILTTDPGGAYMLIYFVNNTVSRIETYFYTAN